MTALLDEEVLASSAPVLSLPDVFGAQMTDTDEPVHGELREIFPRTARRSRPDPVELRPGDYLLDHESSTVPAGWMRVDGVTHTANGSQVRFSTGLGITVPAGRSKWVWCAADVMAWACLGESAGVL